MIEPTFGERLRQLRKKAGKNQTTVANELNERYPDARVSQTTVSALEGRISAPREDVLRILAEYYDVPVGHFFELVEDREQHIDFARAYIRSLHERKFPPSDKPRPDPMPAEQHNLRFWQPEFGEDEYFEN